MTTTYEQGIDLGNETRFTPLLNGLAKHLGGMVGLTGLSSNYAPLTQGELPEITLGLRRFVGSRVSHGVHICHFVPGADAEPSKLISFLGHDVAVEEGISTLNVTARRYTRPNSPEVLCFPFAGNGTGAYISAGGETLGAVAYGKVGQVVIAALGPHPQVTLLTVPPVDRY